MKKCRNLHFLSMLCLGLALGTSSFGQTVISHYPEGRIYLANGFTLEGKDLNINSESASIEIMGQQQVVMLSEVLQIQAKQAKGTRYARNCAGACVGCNLLLFLTAGGKGMNADGEEFDLDPVQYALEAILWGGISYGVGFLIGRATDDWEVVYLKRN